MDESYKDALKYFKIPIYKTLILSIIDEIVPRKPFIEILNKMMR